MTATGAIYGYDGDAAGAGSSGWVVYNLTTDPSVNLAPGQGFLVTANTTSATVNDITFDPSIRRIDVTDDLIPGRLSNRAFIKLQASIGTSNFNTVIHFNEPSTTGLDFGYDAAVFGSNAAARAIYSQLVQDNTGVDLAIQSLAYNDLGSNVIIPIGINVPQGQQVTVSIADSTVPEYITVYLEDRLTNTFTLLNSSDYVFTPNSNLNDVGRFYLRFMDNTLSLGANDLDVLQIYALNKTLFINGLLNSATSVGLYDIQGRKVLSSGLESETTNNSMDVSNVSTGVYIVKLSNGSQEKTQRVIIK